LVVVCVLGREGEGVGGGCDGGGTGRVGSAVCAHARAEIFRVSPRSAARRCATRARIPARRRAMIPSADFSFPRVHRKKLMMEEQELLHKALSLSPSTSPARDTPPPPCGLPPAGASPRLTPVVCSCRLGWGGEQDAEREERLCPTRRARDKRARARGTIRRGDRGGSCCCCCCCCG